MAPEMINAALCSFGMSGQVFHAPFLHEHRGFNLSGVWERSKKLAQQKYPAVKSFTSLEGMLADPYIDLVIVNTPTYTHYDYAKKALQAGKHVVVEKAFTATLAEAEELKQLAAEKGKKIAVFQNRRWDSDFLTVRSVIEKGVLGDVLEAEFHFDRYNPNLSPKLHKEDRNPAGGILHDLGPHLIDQALSLFGMPQTLFADLRILRPASKVVDDLDIILFYPSLKVRLKAGYFVKLPIPSFIVHGRNGSFLKKRGDVQEARLQAGDIPGSEGYGIELPGDEGILNYIKEGTDIKETVATLPGNYMVFYEGVYDAIIHNKPMPVTADDGINVMKVIEAAIKSNKEKRVGEV